MLHALVVAAYVPLRPPPPQPDEAVSEFEMRVAMVLAAVAASKLRSAASAEGWTATLILYAETAVVAMLVQAGSRRTAAVVAFVALGAFCGAGRAGARAHSSFMPPSALALFPLLNYAHDAGLRAAVPQPQMKLGTSLSKAAPRVRPHTAGAPHAPH